MSFFSTRGGACVTASQAILWGLARDGGLYVPSMFPHIPLERLSLLCGKSFNQDACQALWECLLHARQGDKYFAYLRSIDIHCNSDGCVTDPILQERPPRCKSPP